MRAEAAVVGGGPAGLIAARELAGRGFEVKVFEEHQQIGIPNHCAGILSKEGLGRIGVDPDVEFLRHEIRGGTVFSPDGIGIRIDGGRTRAYVVDREIFDRYLAGMAQDSGAEIEMGHRIRELRVKNGKVMGVRGDSDIETNIVIDAEGASGTLVRNIGLSRPLEGILAGINANVSDVELEPGMVEVWFGEKLARGLFAWNIPIGDREVRCGLATRKGDPLKLLRGFLRRRFGFSKCSEPVNWYVLTSGPVERTYSDGLLIVGDVAGQAKPTTGGGVILGGMCAIRAAETAAEALNSGDCSADLLSRYENRWRNDLEKEFSAMLTVREFLNGIPDDRMDRVFTSLKAARLEPVLESLVKKGDMDLQSGVLRTALSHPRMIRVLASSLGRIAMGELKELLHL